jgi:pyridoxal 5-phosphate dependent beta-lyase
VADDLPRLWQHWREQRPPTRGIHVDSAAAGRSSFATIQAVTDHLHLEAEVGAYIAQASADAVLTALRGDVANLLGVETDGVAFVESASAALQALLGAWPLPDHAQVAVAPSEWAPNLAAFAARGLDVVELPTDGAGVVDPDGLGRLLAISRPALVHICQVAAHRGLVQPVADLARVCRAADVPLWVDAAQALGHVDVATDADVVYATSRKWLCGPRGVGMLGIASQWWPSLRVRHHVLAPIDEGVARALESDDAHIAGRVALATSIRQLRDIGASTVWQRLDEVGRLTRAALLDLPSWSVLDANGTAITALRPTRGQDVAIVRARLLDEYGILATASTPARAPRDMTEPLLRLSPHVDCSSDQLGMIRTALHAIG